MSEKDDILKEVEKKIKEHYYYSAAFELFDSEYKDGKLYEDIIKKAIYDQKFNDVLNILILAKKEGIKIDYSQLYNKAINAANSTAKEVEKELMDLVKEAKLNGIEIDFPENNCNRVKNADERLSDANTNVVENNRDSSVGRDDETYTTRRGDAVGLSNDSVIKSDASSELGDSEDEIM